MSLWRPGWAWPVVRDVGITGTGLIVVWSQLLLWALDGRTPSDGLLGAGLSLLVPTAAAHIQAVLGVRGAGYSSSSSSSPPSPPPSSSPRAEEEPGGK